MAASNFERREKSLDRFERLFSKRGRSSSTRAILSRLNKHHQPQHQHLTSPSPTPQPDPETQTFPSPSFLRPTTTRMLARDEVKVTARSQRRAQSLPETPNSHVRMPSIDESISASISYSSTTTISTSFPRVPSRSSSLLQRRRDPSIAGLLEFSFHEKRTWTRNDSISSSGTDPASPRRKSSLKQVHEHSIQLQEALPIFASRRPPTPPYSDRSDRTSPSPTRFNKALPHPPRLSGVFSPEPSPERQSFRSSNPIYNEYNYQQIAEMSKSQKHRSLEGPDLLLITGAVSLRKTVSDSTLSKTTPPVIPVPAPAPSPDIFPDEPTVENFLSLSDDDIADGPPPVTPPPSSSRRFGSRGRRSESGGGGASRSRGLASNSRASSGRAPTFDLPPDPPVFHMPSPRSGSRRTSPLISLSSVLTSRPSRAGAFECRRIADRYGFDLIYIVNLWALDIIAQPPTPTSTSHIPAPGESFGSPSQRREPRGRGCNERTYSPSPYRSINGGRPTMTGRLLAGHNLSTVQTPFLISPDVHQKVLRQEGWLEYRSERVRADEFARGYSCAFYAGYGSTPDSASSSSTSTSTNNNNNNTNSGGGASSARNTSVMSLSEKRRSQQLKNRGIVFAAYRLPDENGKTPKGCDAAQLKALHAEAETLVEMLLDIHKTSRGRDLATGKGGAAGEAGLGGGDDVGPLPVRRRYEPFFVN
ncbi:hypothetical protein GE09DRAFT_159927 [Coniochaeta sp. 2T2.1]|nr:hypothetical protein GE09DRAFT_159927 [Coniochaeta sp. 2T2.1]